MGNEGEVCSTPTTRSGPPATPAGSATASSAPSPGGRLRSELRNASYAEGEQLLSPSASRPGTPGPGANTACPPRERSAAEVASERNFQQVVAATNFRNFMRSLEELRPGGTGDQVTLFTQDGSQRIYNRGDALAIRARTSRELAQRLAQLEGTLDGAEAAMQVFRANNQDATNPIDFPRLERAYTAARARVRTLRAALAAGRFLAVAEGIGAAASQSRAVRMQVDAIRDDTIVAEATTYGLEFVRDTSLAVFAVAAVASTGGLAGAALTAGAAMTFEGMQQVSEVGNGLRQEVSPREILVRGALAGLTTLVSAGAADLVASAGGRLLVADVEAILVREGIPAARAALLAPSMVRSVVNWALERARTEAGAGNRQISAATGVSPRTSDTRAPAVVNQAIRDRLPAPTEGGDAPLDSAFEYIQTLDYERLVRGLAQSSARDHVAGGADVAGQTPARPNVTDTASQRVAASRRGR